jgi:glucosamine--fructose-6-phosphate aminotransferase (isomerizing)
MEHEESDLKGTELWKMLGRSQAISKEALEIQEVMESGALDSGLEVGTATRLSSLLDFLLGRMPLDGFMHRFKQPGTVGNLLGRLVEQLSLAINELCRPIDAIKHQAKTVTVGISRAVERPLEGPLWSFFKEFELEPDAVTAGHGNILTAMEPLLAEVSGATLYRVEGLTPIGKPLHTTTIQVERKFGYAREVISRCEQPRRLAGTKWGVVADGRVFLGHGDKDDRHILILPLLGQTDRGQLLLYHIELLEKGPRDKRMAALRALQDRYKQLLICVTEATNREWDPAMIDGMDNEQLFFADPRKVGEMLAAGQLES